MNKQGLVYTVIITFSVSFVLVAVLSLTNELVRARIERNQLLRERRSVLNAFGIETTGTAEDFELYDERITEETVDGNRLYQARTDGGTAYGIRFTGSGLWGTITGALAVRPDLSRMVGMDIIEHNETPGLGGRIDEPWFKRQFRGERIDEASIAVSGAGGGDEDKDNARVDAVTGATRTSDSLEAIINRYLERLDELKGAL